MPIVRRGRARGARTSVRAGDEVLLAAAARLTERDRDLIRLVGEHRVLTTAHLAAAGFGSVITARHRLTVLTGLGLLRRFRPHAESGSAPWHYLLGPAGAALLGAEDADDRKWLAAVRSDRQLALARSQRLVHQVGANGFFVALLAEARAGGDAELRAWLSEQTTIEWLDRARPWGQHTDLPRPDGLGTWAEHGSEVTFVLEYDTGTEHQAQLAGKLPGYRALAHAMADAGRTCPLLLFSFPGPRREQAARRALAACPEAAALRIATTAAEPGQASPAGPVWLPLLPGWPGGRVALYALDTAMPDPWQHYRAERQRERDRAEQARSQAPWAGDPDDPDGTADDQCEPG